MTRLGRRSVARWAIVWACAAGLIAITACRSQSLTDRVATDENGPAFILYSFEDTNTSDNYNFAILMTQSGDVLVGLCDSTSAHYWAGQSDRATSARVIDEVRDFMARSRDVPCPIGSPGGPYGTISLHDGSRLEQREWDEVVRPFWIARNDPSIRQFAAEWTRVTMSICEHVPRDIDEVQLEELKLRLRAATGSEFSEFFGVLRHCD